MTEQFAKRANAYFWVPKYTHRCGDLCFSATPRACTILKELIDLVIRGALPQRTIQLPGTSQSDVAVVGGGLHWSAKILRLDCNQNEDRNLVVTADPGEKRVSLHLCGKSKAQFEQVLSEVSRGNGDQSIPAVINGVQTLLWYWPCFGHLWVSKEPEYKFEE